MTNKYTHISIVSILSISFILAACSFFQKEGEQRVTVAPEQDVTIEKASDSAGAEEFLKNRFVEQGITEVQNEVLREDRIARGVDIFFYQRNTSEDLAQKDPMLLRTMLRFEPFVFQLPPPSAEEAVNILVGDSELSFRAVDIFDVGDEENRERVCSKDVFSRLCPENNGVIVEIDGAEVLLPEGDLLLADMSSGQRIWISAEEVDLSDNKPSIISVTQFQPTGANQEAVSIRLAGENVVDLEHAQEDTEMSNMQQKAKRQTDLQIISNFIIQFKIANGMKLPFEIPQETSVAFCKHGAVDCTGLIDVRNIFYDYNKEEFPVDPNASSENSAEYFAEVNSNGKVTVSAPNASEKMSITK